MSHPGPLLTFTDGDADGPLVLVLHDRYETPDKVAISDDLPGARVIRVRSARTQMAGEAQALGYFWFLGPYEKPELTTFGDGLHHLENLFLNVSSAAGKPKGFIIGKGEGGTMALTLAAIWPELLGGVVSIDGPLPENIGSFPIELRPPLALPVLLIEHERSMADTATALTRLGADVSLKQIKNNILQGAIDWIKPRLEPALNGT